MATDPAPDFPTPEWPPVQDVESIDIIGKRNDGGLDMIIVVSQPLDGSAETLAAVRQKAATYLDVIDLPEFQADMEHPPRDRTMIVFACDFPIHPWATAVIAECQAAAVLRGVKVVVRQEKA